MSSELDAVLGRLKGGERLVVAGLGDSLTAGWLVLSGFFERFCDGLASRFPAATIVRVNAGLAGDTVFDGLARVDAVLAEKPDLVVVQFGINDCFGGIYRHEFLETLGVLVRRLREGGATVILATGNPLQDPNDQDALRHFYTAIREAGRSNGVTVAHLDQLWAAHLFAVPGSEGLYQPDGVHPTDRGHEILSLGLLGLFDENPV
jgi:acyl-CoA thioesterase-1